MDQCLHDILFQDGYSAKGFFLPPRNGGIFLIERSEHIDDVRCKGLDADGDACIHRCILSFAAQGT